MERFNRRCALSSVCEKGRKRGEEEGREREREAVVHANDYCSFYTRHRKNFVRIIRPNSFRKEWWCSAVMNLTMQRHVLSEMERFPLFTVASMGHVIMSLNMNILYTQRPLMLTFFFAYFPRTFIQHSKYLHHLKGLNSFQTHNTWPDATPGTTSSVDHLPAETHTRPARPRLSHALRCTAISVMNSKVDFTTSLAPH